jgi:hypothetical protein
MTVTLGAIHHRPSAERGCGLTGSGRGFRCKGPEPPAWRGAIVELYSAASDYQWAAHECCPVTIRVPGGSIHLGRWGLDADLPTEGKVDLDAAMGPSWSKT